MSECSHVHVCDVPGGARVLILSPQCTCTRVPTNKHENIVLEQKLRELFVLKTEGLAGGRTKLHSEQLHYLYWSVNVGGR